MFEFLTSNTVKNISKIQDIENEFIENLIYRTLEHDIKVSNLSKIRSLEIFSAKVQKIKSNGVH